MECVKTTVMHDDGDKFNKGRCVNLGLGHLRGLDWILHIDADIVLPHRFRDLLHRGKLKQDTLYGADRMNVYGFEHWHEHKPKLMPSYTSGYFIQPPKEFPIGARIVHSELGYVPIGFFQLWHKSVHRRYPINQGNAEHTDVLFAAQWAREHRILLPEVLVSHLDSESGPTVMGANWSGRKTPRFECKKKHGHEHHKSHHGHKDHGHGHGHKHHGHDHGHHHHHPKPYKPICD